MVCTLRCSCNEKWTSEEKCIPLKVPNKGTGWLTTLVSENQSHDAPAEVTWCPITSLYLKMSALRSDTRGNELVHVPLSKDRL